MYFHGILNKLWFLVHTDNYCNMIFTNLLTFWRKYFSPEIMVVIFRMSDTVLCFIVLENGERLRLENGEWLYHTRECLRLENGEYPAALQQVWSTSPFIPHNTQGRQRKFKGTRHYLVVSFMW